VVNLPNFPIVYRRRSSTDKNPRCHEINRQRWKQQHNGQTSRVLCVESEKFGNLIVIISRSSVKNMDWEFWAQKYTTIVNQKSTRPQPPLSSQTHLPSQTPHARPLCCLPCHPAAPRVPSLHAPCLGLPALRFRTESFRNNHEIMGKAVAKIFRKMKCFRRCSSYSSNQRGTYFRWKRNF